MTLITNYFSLVKIKRNLFSLILFSFSTVLLSCSSTELNKNEEYTLNFQNEKWESIEPDSSDYAFINQDSKSIIMINSLCKKYEATSLRHLTSNLLSGISNIKTEETKEEKYFSRNALTSKIMGYLDGVPVYLTVVTFSKNRCIYDYVLISLTKNNRKKDEPDLFKVLNSSKIK